jgi:mono/diheme cytochrome c family protein
LVGIAPKSNGTIKGWISISFPKKGITFEQINPRDVESSFNNFPIMQRFLVRTFLAGLILSFAACKPNSSLDYSDLPNDSLTIEKGKSLFLQNCSACHDFRQDGIGPQLGGLTGQVPVAWLQKFISDPKKMIDQGDERAAALFARYNSYMPSFTHYTEEDINAVIAYLHTIQAPVSSASEWEEAIEPAVAPITFGDYLIQLRTAAQIPASSGKDPLARIAKMDYQPGSEDLYVLDLRGKLYRLKDGEAAAYLEIDRLIPDFIDAPGLATGFGSFAFHPEFKENGLLYTTHTEKAGSAPADFTYADSVRVSLQWVISEWKTEDPAAIPFKGARRELLRINMVGPSHGVQELTFNPLAKPGDEDYGLIYLGVGDGGSVGAGFSFVTNSIETIWGSIIRIDPQGNNSENGNYGIPAGNPYSDGKNGNALKEIFAWGFRNPHRISWTKDGKMIASNIGQAQFESLYLISPGNNYGWPVREGTYRIHETGDLNLVYALPEDDAAYNFTYPIAQYSHQDGNAISGGFEYWGQGIPELQGKYIFGDIVNGRVFYIDSHEVKQGQQAKISEFRLQIDGEDTSFGEMFDHKKVDIRFGRDHRGELWISSKIDGKLYRVTGVKKFAAE